MSKKKWMGLISVIVAVSAIVGLMAIPAMADEEETTTPTPQPAERCEAFLDKVSVNLDVSVEQLRSAIADARTEMLDEAVADGLITQEHADQIKQRMEENDGLCGFGMRDSGQKGMRGEGKLGMARGLRGSYMEGVDSEGLHDGFKRGFAQHFRGGPGGCYETE